MSQSFQDISIFELELLASLPRYESLRALARDKDLKPAHVSKVFNRLEKKLQQRLFERSNVGYSLTEDGDRLTRAADQTLSVARLMHRGSALGRYEVYDESLIEDQIRQMHSREWSAYKEKDVHQLLKIFHPDMVWTWADPKSLDLPRLQANLGRFDARRWSNYWAQFFEKFSLVTNDSIILDIRISPTLDAAVSRVQTQMDWQGDGGEKLHWDGLLFKTYTRMPDGWRLISQAGPFKFVNSDRKVHHLGVSG